MKVFQQHQANRALSLSKPERVRNPNAAMRIISEVSLQLTNFSLTYTIQGTYRHKIRFLLFWGTNYETFTNGPLPDPGQSISFRRET
jgi:hypothetical protein